MRIVSFFLFLLLCNVQAEDLLDDILSFESSSLADSLKLDATYGGGGGIGGGGGSANGGTNGSNSDLVIKQEPSAVTDAEMHAMAKDRQKKDNHNMSKSITNRKHNVKFNGSHWSSDSNHNTAICVILWDSWASKAIQYKWSNKRAGHAATEK